jgi:hypothetical protein
MQTVNGPVLLQLINGLTMRRSSARSIAGIRYIEVHQLQAFVYNREIKRRIL